MTQPSANAPTASGADTRGVRIGSLCTGYGGLDLAAELVTGGTLAWCSDIEPGPRAVIDYRFAARNLGDIKNVDWARVERPHILTAGYPCQPFSAAGKGLGADDPRHLWPFVLDAIRRLRPDLVLLENVRNHLRIGFDQVLADLAGVGFDAEWTMLRASEVGACHARARLFVAAHPTGERRRSWTGLRSGDPAPDGWGLARYLDRPSPADAEGEQRADEPAGSDRPTLPLWPVLGAGGRADAWSPPEGVVVDRRGTGVVAWGVFEPAVRRHERLIGRPHPWPQTDKGLLSAEFVEWMQALPPGWVTDVVGRSTAMRLLGNGVFPPAAVAALDHLLDRCEREETADAA